MTRQEEADEAITNILRSDFNKVNVYVDKYLKPKDPLFEKFVEFMYFIRKLNPQTPLLNMAYPKFREDFAEELNGTKGLDEAIETCSRKYGGDSLHVLDLMEIKERMENLTK